jgi:preprotein translocase subunit YajC
MPGSFEALPLLFAQAAAGGAGAAGAAGAAANQSPSLLTFLPYVVIIGLWFYLLLIRPQQKQEKQRKSMIEMLKKNDKVLTSAGIYGTVLSVDSDDDRVVLRIDDDKGVKVAFSKSSIVRVFDAAADKEKTKAPETTRGS